MKKTFATIASILLLATSCRKEADYTPYIGENDVLAYDNYASQFEFIWKAISTGYVFWDVDTTDWDAAYTRYMPVFQEFDQRVLNNTPIQTAELEQVYKSIMGGMRDHHMTVYIRNMHPADGEQNTAFRITPGSDEVTTRDYYIESAAAERNKLVGFLNNIDILYSVATHESCSVYVDELRGTLILHYCLLTLPDGRLIPYLWQSSAALSPIMQQLGQNNSYGQAASLVDHWIKAACNTHRERLAGIILDTRCNRGGYQDDLDYLVGSFLNETKEVFKTRYKEGPGRLEYSVWTPYYISPNASYHRDLEAERIPYVVLCDIHSASMGEIEPMAIKKAIPTSHTIGERTYGATGPLQPATSIDLNYGGPFGDATLQGYHYIYTSSFETQVNGFVPEGIGFTPDQIVLRKDNGNSFKPQLDSAITYIANW